MISDWRGDRRIGRPGLGEVLSTEIKRPLVVTGVMAIASALVLTIRLLFGERYSPAGMVTAWCITFAVFSITVILSAILTRRWAQAWLFLVLSVTLTGLALFATLPVLSMIGLLPDAIVATTPR